MSVARSVSPAQLVGTARQTVLDTLNDEARLAWLSRRLAVAVALLLVAFVGFYNYDRYLVKPESPLDQAVRSLEDAVRQSPGDIQLRVRVADAYVRQGRYPQAITQYGEALKLQENHMPALFGMAAAELLRNNEVRAEELYRQIVDLNRDNEDRYSSRDMEAAYYRLALFASKAGRHDEAAEWAREALKADRTDADVLYLLGTSEEARGNQEAARGAFRQAVSFDPNFRDGFAALGRTAAALGDSREASYARGMELLAAGDVDGALAEFQRLIAAAPDYGEAYQGLGLAYGKKGQREESIQAFRTALERNPDLFLAKWSLGS
ncbi:MAG: tetratricopeptide repeat protein [Chloroflexi bacterium]|nr:tetratricopeptide repeat protein [Chloroflexota bacterium]